jgi:hypothetical protein
MLYNINTRRQLMSFGFLESRHYNSDEPRFLRSLIFFGSFAFISNTINSNWDEVAAMVIASWIIWYVIETTKWRLYEAVRWLRNKLHKYKI